VNSPALSFAAAFGVMGLLVAGGWWLSQASPHLDRAVASLTLSEAASPDAEAKQPRERHRAERARRPARRPTRPVTYDW